jgi:hypothetical protein
MAKNLVETLQGDSIATDLDLAYRTLAQALLAHRNRSEAIECGVDAVSLDRAVGATEAVIDLNDAHKICHRISALSERPGEVFDNLGHMFVLLQAESILREKCFLTSTRCAPTQQSKHEGVRIADLEGDGWALEAYGGVDLRNNSKLALDLRALFLVKSTLPRTFLAFRQSAYDPVADVKDGDEVPLRATCPARRGGPFSTHAKAKVVSILNGVIVLETGPIDVTVDADPKQDELRQ